MSQLSSVGGRSTRRNRRVAREYPLLALAELREFQRVTQLAGSTMDFGYVPLIMTIMRRPLSITR